MKKYSFAVLQAVYKNDNPLFLSESLQSIANNTILPDYIVLVKDGLLTDELETVIKIWQTKLPMKIVGYQQSQGLAHALNFGLQFINTDFVARMDSDDYCFPYRFEKQMDYLEKNPDVDILGTAITEFYINKNNKEFRKNRFYPLICSKTSISLYKGTPLAHPTVMIKTNVLKKFLYLEQTNMNEDIDLWFRLLKSNYTINNIQEPLINFRITEGTFKRRSIKKAFSEFSIYFKNLLDFSGLSPLLIYPILRLITRFLPYSVNKKLYFSKIRHFLFSKKK